MYLLIVNTSGLIVFFPTGSLTNLGPKINKHVVSICCGVVTGSMDTQEINKVVSHSMETRARITWKTDNVILQCFFFTNSLVVFVRNHRENLPKQIHN